jgi:hypothetical protein
MKRMLAVATAIALFAAIGAIAFAAFGRGARSDETPTSGVPASDDNALVMPYAPLAVQAQMKRGEGHAYVTWGDTSTVTARPSNLSVP